MKKKENHNIEFKQSWQEKSMESICAFANTNGGILYIGKDDTGNITGISDAKELMDQIPNKIFNILGFPPEVRLKKENGKEFIEVEISSQTAAISLRGKFYSRSGSSNLELKGTQLQNFLLNKSAQKWEDLLEDKATLNDIDDETIIRFKELTKTRFPSATKEKSLRSLLEKLHLFNHGKLTKAAILLFGKDPQKFYKNAHLKIGSFSSETELKSTDLIEGNLFQQIEHVMSLLKNKYLNYSSRIEGLYRKEELEYPEEALREAIINSLIHRDYIGAHTQLRIDKDSLSLWNFGELPAELTIERLKEKHKSLPRNPRLADVFYKAGLIESWGRGTTKIIEELSKAGLPEPVYENKDGGFSISFLKDVFTEEQLKKSGLTDRHIKAIQYLKEYGKITNKEYRDVTDSSERTATRDLSLLVKKNVLVQIGTTGKGTEYTLRGHKGAKDAKKLLQKSDVNKDATKTPKAPHDELDRKLSLLKKELSKVNPENEIKSHFDANVFFAIYDSWLSELLKKLIKVAQKFNEFYTKPNHYITMTNGGGSVRFTDEKQETIIKKFREDCEKQKDRMYSSSALALVLNYSTFKQTNKERKAFGCTYQFEVEFDMINYKIFMDAFTEEPKRLREFRHERLLHESLTPKEIKKLEEELGSTLLKHIEVNTKKMGIR